MDSHDVCATCLDIPTNPFELPCKHIFCYLCLKQVAEDHKPCPTCNALIPDFVLEKAKVSEDVINLSETAGKWMYSGRTNGWWYYSPEHDKIIEDVWKVAKNLGPNSLGSIIVNINILGRTYKIDFATMTQTGERVTRKIKRVEEFEESEDLKDVVKGISGIQVVKKENLPTMSPPEWLNPNQYVFHPTAWNNNEEENTEEYEESVGTDIDQLEASELAEEEKWE